jgi:hypothetical protein
MVQPTTLLPKPTKPTNTAGIPSSLPKVIAPAGGSPPQPPNSTLIQLGFTYALNYEFVVTTPASASQIFLYTPPGVSFGLDIDRAQVLMQSIQPYDTSSRLGYITTLALAYIPQDLVNPLSLQLHNPYSKLYNNPDPSVKTMMSMLDPTIPLISGQSPSGSSLAGYGSASPTDPTGTNGDDGAGGANKSSTSIRPSSIGIGCGVVGGAAIYGAAMFFVARRYRKKRQLHRRSQSIGGDGNAVSEVQEISPAMIGGGRSDGFRSTTPYGAGGRTSQNSGGSTRTQMISAPVMAENSLGWN